MKLSSNFDFLEVHNPQLVRLGSLAEQYLSEDPNISIIKIRQFGELLAQQVAAQVGLYVSTKEEQISLLNRLASEGLLKGKAGNLFHQIRIKGNDAVHDLVGDYDTGLRCLQYAHELGAWYHRAFGGATNFSANFTIPIKISLQEQLGQLEQLLEETEAKAQEVTQQLEATQAHVNTLSQENIQRTIEQAKQAETDILKVILTGHNNTPDFSEGYSIFTDKLDTVTLALKSIITLIGSFEDTPITLSSGESVTPGLGLINEANVLTTRAKDIRQGILKMMVLGEFKNGKSTLLNAMIGSKKLPAKVNPTTAIITSLVYGKSNDVSIYEADQPEPRIISWEDFIDEFQLTIEDQETLNKQNLVDRFHHIEYAQIECQHPLCKSGVRLIDSPGLAEHIYRTRITTGFLQQCQAVIFVLNAIQILGQREKEFIESNFRKGNISNVFFVVNRINLVEEDEVEELKYYVRRYLKDFFVDNQGNVDQELMQRRLFFVNAKGALNARLSETINERQLERSGVVELERELEEFLTSNQRFRASLQSTLDFLVCVMVEVKQKIAQKQHILDEPLAELEKRRLHSEERLQVLERKEAHIRRLIEQYSRSFINTLCGNLREYIITARNNWEFDYKEFIPLDDMNFTTLLASTIDNTTRKALADKFNEGTQKYIHHIFKEWSATIPTIINDDLVKLTEEVNAEIKYFAEEIATIENLFSTGSTVDSYTVAHNQEQKFLQLLVSMLIGDFSNMSEIIVGEGDWGKFIVNSIQQMILVGAVLTIFGGPIEWIVLLLIELFTGWHSYEKSKKKLLFDVGKKVFAEMDEQTREMQWLITEKVTKQFTELSNKITQILQQQIDEIRSEQDRLIEQTRDKKFAIEREKIRLNQIQNEVIIQFNKISEIAYNQTFTIEQIEWLNQGKIIMSR